MAWRNPPPTWPTLRPLVDEPKDAAGLSALIHRPAAALAQFAKRSEGPAGAKPGVGSRPQRVSPRRLSQEPGRHNEGSNG
jgi:hypothetical protein